VIHGLLHHRTKGGAGAGAAAVRIDRAREELAKALELAKGIGAGRQPLPSV